MFSEEILISLFFKKRKITRKKEREEKEQDIKSDVK